MEKYSSSWTKEGLCSFLYSHIWWHFALLLVENKNFKKALEIYDEHLFPLDTDDIIYKDDLQVQLNAMELLWKLQVNNQIHLQRWTQLIPFVKKTLYLHHDLLHSILALRGLHLLNDSTAIESYFTTLNSSGLPTETKSKFRYLSVICLEIFNGQFSSRKKLMDLQSDWSIVGNSTEQRLIFLELAKGKPVVCGKILE